MLKMLIPLVCCLCCLGSSLPANQETSKIEATTASSHLLQEFTSTQEVVAEFSKGNFATANSSLFFLTRLLYTYNAGEGLIERDVLRVLHAVRFAAEKHQHQVRKDLDSTPYIIHPIGVAHQLLSLGNVRDADILIAALLHDTVEDTETSFEEIRTLFGRRVEGFVREVTDDKSLSKVARKEMQIVHAPHKSAGAAQIKLSDKLYNLNDLLNFPPPNWDSKRIDEYFNWAEKVVEALPWVNAKLKASIDEKIATHRRNLVLPGLSEHFAQFLDK